MVSRQTANRLLKSVYYGGLREAKRELAESAKQGDKDSRQLLNAIGLYEQGNCEPFDAQDLGLSPKQVAWGIREVVAKRESVFLIGGLVEGMLSGTPVATAVETLKSKEITDAYHSVSALRCDHHSQGHFGG